MRNMGGLAKKMPITYWTYLIGTLALAGIFPLSGFWSKDEILGKAFSVGITDGKPEGVYALVLLLIAAAFTAFYMWRQMNLVFFGKPRTDAAENAPESNNFMTIPLIILAVLAFFGGLLNLPNGVPAIVSLEGLTLWLEESVTFATGGSLNLPLALFATAVALGAIGLAQLVYGKKPLVPMTAEGKDVQETNAFRPIFSLANAKLYWDEIYGTLIEQPFNRLSKIFADVVDWRFWHDYVHNNVIRDGFNGLAAFFAGPVDKGFIDWAFDGVGGALKWISSKVRRTETGYVRTYAFTMLVGVIFVLLLILFPLIRQLLNR
jgi:NADH-quinone oxidoreductase subunit L